MNLKQTLRNHPLGWVPTLYFAQGLPFAVVLVMTFTMYQKLGIPNEQITKWTALLGTAWIFKAAWSPFLELVKSKKAVVVGCQLISGALLVGTALVLPLPGFFIFSIGLLSLVAFGSATHDIAADGLYIENMTKHQQSIYSGWLGAFWNGGKLFVTGGLVTLAGVLEQTMSAAATWSIVTAIPGVILIALAFYHMWAMPPLHKITKDDVSIGFIARTLKDVTIEFFKKPGIWVAILFIILFRAGEGQVQTIGRLFLTESVEKGGLGMSTYDFGLAYGTVGSITFIAGSILGGYFAAWLGLRKSMFLLILAMNLPSITFWYLSAYLPTNFYVIATAIGIESFGYGFGFVGVILYIMQVVAPGKYPTAHYALGTGIMQLGLVIFTGISGDIQKWLGYHNFFIWGLVAAVPVLIMSLVVKLDDKSEDNKTETARE